MAKKVPTPREANTFNKVCAMPRDNVGWREFWMLTDGFTVTIARQKPGEMPTQKVNVPKATFDRFIEWYMTGQWPARRTR